VAVRDLPQQAKSASVHIDPLGARDHDSAIAKQCFRPALPRAS
jgi:hypothetical protein